MNIYELTKKLRKELPEFKIQVMPLNTSGETVIGIFRGQYVFLCPAVNIDMDNSTVMSYKNMILRKWRCLY